MGDRACELDVAHAFAADLGQRHFNATLLTDHSAMLEALVLTAQTLVILDRTKNLGAEKTISLRLEGSVVDGLGLFNFAKRPRPNHLRRRQTDTDRVEVFVFLPA